MADGAEKFSSGRVWRHSLGRGFGEGCGNPLNSCAYFWDSPTRRRPGVMMINMHWLNV